MNSFDPATGRRRLHAQTQENVEATLAASTCKFLGVPISACSTGDVTQGSVVASVTTIWPAGTSVDDARALLANLLANGGSDILAALKAAGFKATGVSFTDDTTTYTTTNTKKKSNSIAIGLGVGLGVGIPLVAAVVFFFIWKSKRSAAGVVAPRVGDASS